MKKCLALVLMLCYSVCFAVGSDMGGPEKKSGGRDRDKFPYWMLLEQKKKVRWIPIDITGIAGALLNGPVKPKKHHHSKKGSASLPTTIYFQGE